jgi:hypothetical protein
MATSRSMAHLLCPGAAQALHSHAQQLRHQQHLVPANGQEACPKAGSAASTPSNTTCPVPGTCTSALARAECGSMSTTAITSSPTSALQLPNTKGSTSLCVRPEGQGGQAGRVSRGMSVAISRSTDSAWHTCRWWLGC